MVKVYEVLGYFWLLKKIILPEADAKPFLQSRLSAT
jgi:hypothetical protein